MDPFHVVRLAADKLDECRRRVQNSTLGHRGRKGDLLYGFRRTMLTRMPLVTPQRAVGLDEVLTVEEHVAVQVTWRCYQDLLAAYQDQDRRAGKLRFYKLAKGLREKVTNDLKELRSLGRTLRKRLRDILTYFDTKASNGPVEAINGRSEHLRGIDLRFFEQGPLHLEVTDPLRRAPGTDQRTVNREESACSRPARTVAARL